MRIDSIYLRDVGPFNEVRIDLPEGKDPNLADVYLLTGPNGCGKSTVLYAIAAALSGGDATLGRDLVQRRLKSANGIAAVKMATLVRAVVRPQPLRRQGPALASPFGGGIHLREIGDNGHYRSHADEIQFSDRAAALNAQPHERFDWAAFSHAGARDLGDGRVTAITPQHDSPFNESLSFHRVGNSTAIAQWIANQEFKRLKAREEGRNERAEQIARSVTDIEQIVAEVTDDPTFKFIGGYETDIDVRVRRHGATIDMGLLPDGVKSVVSWVADLLMRLDRIPWIDNTPPMERSFLLLLDEIDIHLHPEWQRRVIPVVQKLFSKAQIIASTHSPFVVASATDAHVISFDMDKGVSTLASVRTSQIGRSYRAILEDIFDVTSEFDVDTETLFAKFYAEKAHLFANGTIDRTEVDRIARELASRGEEVADIMGLEMRQLDRQLAQRVAD